MADPACLSGLPAELLEYIAQYAGGDIRQLRLASRHIAAQVLPVFKKSFFSDLTVMLATESSLRKAIDVVDHEVLGSNVRKLVLVDDLLSEWNPSWEARSEQENIVRRGQLELYARRDDIRLLIELFRKCARTGKVSTIQFQGFIEGKHGPPREMKDFEHGYPLTNNENCFIRTMNALVISGAHFESFTMETDVAPGNIYTDSMTGLKAVEFTEDHYKGLACTAAFHRFQTLDLTIDAGHGYDEINHVTFLANLPLAKILSLRVRPKVEDEANFEYSSERVIEALMRLEFSFLHTLALRWFETDWKTLLSFLKRQKNLRKVAFYAATVKNIPRGLRRDQPGMGACPNKVVHHLSHLTGIAKIESTGPDAFYDLDEDPGW